MKSSMKTAAVALVAMLGFSGTSLASLKCTGSVQWISVSHGSLVAKLANQSSALVCQLAGRIENHPSIGMANPLLDIDKEECKAWQDTLLTAISADKPVSLFIMTTPSKKCDQLGPDEYWRVRSVEIGMLDQRP